MPESKNQQSKQPQISERKWVKYLLILTGVVIILSIVFNTFFQEEIPIKENTWNNLVTPGYKFTKAAQNQLGDPIDIKTTELGTQYNYQSVFPIHPNNVTTSEDDVVKFVEEFVDYDPNNTLDQYNSKFGEPSLQLFAPKFGDHLLANVFLDQGLVVFTHRYANTVERIWYFEPTTESEFMANFGQDLSTEPSGPETFQ